MNKTQTRNKYPGHSIIKAIISIGEGIKVSFADGCEGNVPFEVIPGVKNNLDLINIELPNPFEIIVNKSDGSNIELPWDFLRRYCDSTYGEKVEKIAIESMKSLGKRIRTIREKSKLTQSELASVAGIGRITEVRIEAGEQSPRYATLKSIADALKCQFTDLISENSNKSTIQKGRSYEITKTDAMNSDLSEKVYDKNNSIARVKVEQALDKAVKGEWETSLGLLKEVEAIVPLEFADDIKIDIKMVWLCLQKTYVGPLIDLAENSISMLDYTGAGEILSRISHILKISGYPLDCDDYSNRIIDITISACAAADIWENLDKKLDRTLIGVSFIKSSFEDLIEKDQESRPFPFRQRSKV